MKPLFLVALCAALFACGDSKIRSMDDYELSERYGKCLDNKPSAPGSATACENLRKECERRRRELGFFVCRTI